MVCASCIRQIWLIGLTYFGARRNTDQFDLKARVGVNDLLLRRVLIPLFRYSKTAPTNGTTASSNESGTTWLIRATGKPASSLMTKKVQLFAWFIQINIRPDSKSRC